MYRTSMGRITCPISAACPIFEENASHCLGRRSKEMSATVPSLYLVGIYKPDIGFMHQRWASSVWFGYSAAQADEIPGWPLILFTRPISSRQFVAATISALVPKSRKGTGARCSAISAISPTGRNERSNATRKMATSSTTRQPWRSGNANTNQPGNRSFERVTRQRSRRSVSVFRLRPFRCRAES